MYYYVGIVCLDIDNILPIIQLNAFAQPRTEFNIPFHK